MSNRFQIRPTPIAGVVLLDRRPVEDSRGFLERLFCVHDLQEVVAGQGIVQINRTLTRHRGTVRGLHYQRPPHAETKLVTCLRGEVFDVAVDLRAGSPTFLQWHAEQLSARRPRTLVIPAGCAHGLQTLGNDCELLYFHTAPHVPAAEAGIDPRDPLLAITWPLAIAGLSPRDESLPRLDVGFTGIRP